jgi:pyrimidine-nucleoside phosphorylase
MRVVDLIVRKRNGGKLTRAEIDELVSGVTTSAVPEYQTAALLMAIVFQGLDRDETAWLTDAMVRSGQRIDLRDVPGVKIGKHSTGGVGDKLSLIVVPIVAACGAIVPKSSGRALGHSGGTIDKLESIPGFQVSLTSAAFRAALRAHGCAIIGQTADLAPADKKLYALRDVTGTIESLPLIASSIMSKKIAEGTDALVLDVKVGAGAFMKSDADARRLAEAMVGIGTDVGLRTRALLTTMDAPLGHAVGNALEVVEAIETLKGRGPDDLTTLARALASHMVELAGLADSLAAAEARVDDVLSSGAALERLRRLIAGQGGDVRVVDDYGRLPAAARVEPLRADRAGVVASVDASRIGRASMALGAGRDRLDSPIDYGAGIMMAAAPGVAVAEGDTLAELHVGATARLDEARMLAAEAFVIADAAPVRRPVLLDVIA